MATNPAPNAEDRLRDEIAAYEAMRGELETHHMGKWVVIKDRRLAGTFDTVDNAARDAIQKFGRGPYLIRKVGAPPPVRLAM